VLGEIEADEERESREALLEMARAYKSERASGANGLGGQQTSGVDVTNVLRELELDESDTRVQNFRARNFSSESEAYREAALLLKSITSKQPSDADLPSGVAKGAMKPDEAQRLMQEYEQKSKTARGQALVNLKMEYRKKGLRSIY
jgi:polyhydroxyalkanoate synthesis regulator phasin